MSQSVKLSDEIVQDARLTATVARRSIAEQIEFWAQFGRAVEPLLEGTRAMALQRAAVARPLSEYLASVDTSEGCQRVRTYLSSRPFPHYEMVPDGEGLLVRVDEDGTRTRGRFVGREFRAFDRRPVLVALAGPNGAGKTTFFASHLASTGLRFVNADILGDELGLAPYQAARGGWHSLRYSEGRGEAPVISALCQFR